MTVAGGSSILLVETDRDRGSSLAQQLAADGYRVDVARTAEHARILARAAAPELAVVGRLDTPRGALALLQEIRATVSPGSPWDSGMPVVALGCARGELEVLRAFEAGADDFVSSAAGYLELRARIRAIVRRTSAPPLRRRWLEVGPLAIDMHRRTALLAERGLVLRRMEFELLAHMAADPTRVFSREELLCNVWGYRSAGSTRTLASHVSRLRGKLACDSRRRWLVNVRGVGYRLI
jgi:DNA-binding response OmpR family regulator